MTTPGFVQRDLEDVLHPITDFAELHETGPLGIERGEGIYVFDTDGRRLIEGVAAAWCMSLGYGEEELVSAAADQMRKLAYNPAFYGRATEPVANLAHRLKEMAPFDASKVFFVNSGSEGNDTQVRLLWYANNVRGRRAKKKVISRHGSYHGSGGLSASLTGMAAFHADWDAPADFVVHVSSPHHYRGARDGESEEQFSARLAGELDEVIRREGADTVGAMIIDPVQTSAGVIVPPAGYFDRIQEVLERHDVRLIVDEVVTAFGRTGAPFGSDTYGLRPNSITIAKQLSSAYLPIGAVLVDAELDEAVQEGGRLHGMFGQGYTYGGHPVCAAVALRTLELYDERDIPAHVDRVGAYLRKRLHELESHPLVGEVQTVGMLGGVELVADKLTKAPFEPALRAGKVLRRRCEHHGLIVRNVGDRICFAPPLVITEPQVDEMLDAFGAALDDTTRLLRSAA